MIVRNFDMCNKELAEECKILHLWEKTRGMSYDAVHLPAQEETQLSPSRVGLGVETPPNHHSHTPGSHVPTTSTNPFLETPASSSTIPQKRGRQATIFEQDHELSDKRRKR